MIIIIILLLLLIRKLIITIIIIIIIIMLIIMIIFLSYIISLTTTYILESKLKFRQTFNYTIVPSMNCIKHVYDSISDEVNILKL